MKFDKLIKGDVILMKMAKDTHEPDDYITDFLAGRGIDIIWIPHDYEFVVVRPKHESP